MVEWMDGEGMAEDLKDEKYEQEACRLRLSNHIIEVLGRRTQTHTTDELFELGQLMAFPWAPVSSPMEVLENPQLKGRQFFVDTDDPGIERPSKYPGVPYRFDDFGPDRYKGAPRIGEDNVQIYQGELGLSEDDMKGLSSIGVI